MRVSQDSDSWKAGGIVRRDFRSGKVDYPERELRGKSKRKNTKRWCKGREGREHVPEIKRTWQRSGVFDKNGKEILVVAYSEVVCSVCGANSWHMPDEVLAKVLPEKAKQLELASKWCQEGHLYDTQVTTWGSTRKTCVMCGKHK